MSGLAPAATQTDVRLEVGFHGHGLARPIGRVPVAPAATVRALPRLEFSGAHAVTTVTDALLRLLAGLYAVLNIVCTQAREIEPQVSDLAMSVFKGWWGLQEPVHAPHSA